jgi:NADPH:quinone reductase-like Zn-dependent oxidoreductase
LIGRLVRRLLMCRSASDRTPREESLRKRGASLLIAGGVGGVGSIATVMPTLLSKQAAAVLSRRAGTPLLPAGKVRYSRRD